MPKVIQSKIILILGIYQSNLIYRYDKARYKNNYSSPSNKTNINRLESKLVFHSHSIEKGLSHNDVRLGFGKATLNELFETLRIYDSQRYDKNRKAYTNAISVLNSYVRLHEETGYDLAGYGPIKNKYMKIASNSESSIGGIEYVHKNDKLDNSQKSFSELMKTRYSVREFEDGPVAMDSIYSAIEMSMKTPTVCNRQSMRVKIVKNSNMIKHTLVLQGGLTGYDLPPLLLVVTTDNASFLETKDRNQVYTDGGLFSMSLLLALESKSLAACPLNAMMTVSTEKKMRELLSIKQRENIIMFIAVGNFLPLVAVPKSFRYSAKDITEIIG